MGSLEIAMSVFYYNEPLRFNIIQVLDIWQVLFVEQYRVAIQRCECSDKWQVKYTYIYTRIICSFFFKQQKYLIKTKRRNRNGWVEVEGGGGNQANLEEIARNSVQSGGCNFCYIYLLYPTLGTILRKPNYEIYILVGIRLVCQFLLIFK